jgi:hypothetical protein
VGAARPQPRPAAPLRAPAASASLPPRTPAGARPRAAGDGRSRGRVAAIVGGVVGAIAVVGVAVFLILGSSGGGGGGAAPKPNTVTPPASSTTGSGGSGGQAAAKVDRGAVTVAVLNGTKITGLARTASDRVVQKGYKQGVVTNDGSATIRQTTQIFYDANQRNAALDVAKILGVRTSAIQQMTSVQKALANGAQVAVFVGADKAQ